jgi:hypothetical protein
MTIDMCHPSNGLKSEPVLGCMLVEIALTFGDGVFCHFLLFIKQGHDQYKGNKNKSFLY